MILLKLACVDGYCGYGAGENSLFASQSSSIEQREKETSLL